MAEEFGFSNDEDMEYDSAEDDAVVGGGAGLGRETDATSLHSFRGTSLHLVTVPCIGPNWFIWSASASEVAA
jgi:hypothetical protein